MNDTVQDPQLLVKRYHAIPGKLLPPFLDRLALEHRAMQPASHEEIAMLKARTAIDPNQPPAAEPPNDRTIWLKIATADVDRAGDRLFLDGCLLDHFLVNPQLLWMHGLSSEPVHTIGRILRIVHEQDALYALAEYAPEEASPFAEQIYQLDLAGFLPANSIGFHPIEWEENSFGGIDFLQWELIECSKVELPMNPYAINDDFADAEKALIHSTLQEALHWLIH